MKDAEFHLNYKYNCFPPLMFFFKALCYFITGIHYNANCVLPLKFLLEYLKLFPLLPLILDKVLK